MGGLYAPSVLTADAAARPGPTALDGEAKIDCDHTYTDQNMMEQRVVVVGDVTFSNCH